MNSYASLGFAGDYLPSHSLPQGLYPPGTAGIANLEVIVGSLSVDLDKAFPIALSDDAFARLSGCGLAAVSVANNHVYDAGRTAFQKMVRRLETMPGIQVYGLRERPFAELTVGGLRCAVIGCLERCRARGPGLFKEEDVTQLIRSIRSRYDRIFITPHWGREGEFAQHPSPSQRRIARRWVEAGADGIAGHHSHTIHGVEHIDGKPVYYSLGNLMFDHAEGRDYPLTEFGLVVSWTPEAGTAGDRWKHDFICQEAGRVEKVEDGRRPVLSDFLTTISKDVSDPATPWTTARWAREVGPIYIAKARRSWALRRRRHPVAASLLWFLWNLMPTTLFLRYQADSRAGQGGGRYVSLIAKLSDCRRKLNPVPGHAGESKKMVRICPVSSYTDPRLKDAVAGIVTGVDGLASWLGEGRPERRVVVKPNWILDSSLGHAGEWEPVMTHPALLLTIMEVLAGLMKGEGVICVCDAPHTYAAFERIARQGGFLMGVERLKDQFPRMRFEVTDLRREVWVVKEGVVVERRSNPPDPQGYVKVNLGYDSLFFGHAGEGRYYGADYDAYVVNEHHHGRLHEYLMAGTAMQCDLFVNVPKLKTHQKTGMTCCLKNLVGINGDKNWLPHHICGTPSMGGDEFESDRMRLKCESMIKRAVQRLALDFPWLGTRLYRKARRLGLHMLGDSGQRVRNGNWSGNDTCWRMALDLNRALLYGSPDGSWREAPQSRRYLAIVDGITGGEGAGPLSPDAAASGVLIGGSNPAVVDAVACRLMGFDPAAVPIVRGAFENHRWPIADTPMDEIMVDDERIGGLIPLADVRPAIEGGFRPHFAWRDRLAKTERQRASESVGPVSQ